MLNKSESSIEFDILKNKKALHILRAINHPLRLDIIKLIDLKGSLTVTQILIALKIEQSSTSQHLAILRRAGFVTTKKVGKSVHYSLCYDFINHFTKTIGLLF